jgi:hypothetical protein
MDIIYIESCLCNLLNSSEQHIKHELKKLILSLREYKAKEDELESIQTVLSTLQVYDLRYIQAVEDFRVMSHNTGIKYNQEKIDKVQEILCIISCLDFYLLNVLNRNVTKRDNSKKIELEKEREFYKSERFTWTPIIKALLQESQNYMKIKELEKENTLENYLE